MSSMPTQRFLKYWENINAKEVNGIDGRLLAD